MIRKLLIQYRELILYVFWGAATTAVNYCAYFLFTKAILMHYVLANVLAWLIAVLFAFWANKSFVFESKSWAPQVALPELGKFTGARVFSGALETGLLWLCVDILRFPDDIIKVLAGILVIILNYIFSKLFIFRKGEQHG